MAVHDFVAEVKALHTVLTPDSEWSPKLWAELNAELFYNPACKIVFNRLCDMMKMLGAEDIGDSLPSMDFVLSDGEIPDSVRASFLESITSCPTVKNAADFKILTKTLHAKADIRRLARASQAALQDITGSPNPEDERAQIIKNLEQELAKSNDNLFGENFIQIGAEYNQTAEDVYRDILSGKTAENTIKTGYEEFDNVSGGFERTNLVVISATSGGGKSTLVLNLLIRQYLMGYTVALVSFEMSYPEIMNRILSILSEVEMSKIKTNRMLPEEKLRVDAAYREFVVAGARNKCTFNILYSTTAKLADIKGWLHRKGIKADILAIDYLNFLSSSESKDAQWQQLVDITGDCKRLAGQLNCVLYLLAQLDEDYKLKYAKGIKDHANFLWGWVRDEKAKADRLILVKQMKARNAAGFDFTLYERFDICQFRGLNEVDRSRWPDLTELMNEYDSYGLIRMSTSMLEAEEREREARKVIDAEYVSETLSLPEPIDVIEITPERYDKLDVQSRKRPYFYPSINEEAD